MPVRKSPRVLLPEMAKIRDASIALEASDRADAAFFNGEIDAEQHSAVMRSIEAKIRLLGLIMEDRLTAVEEALQQMQSPTDAGNDYPTKHHLSAVSPGIPPVETPPHAPVRSYSRVRRGMARSSHKRRLADLERRLLRPPENYSPGNVREWQYARMRVMGIAMMLLAPKFAARVWVHDGVARERATKLRGAPRYYTPEVLMAMIPPIVAAFRALPPGKFERDNEIDPRFSSTDAPALRALFAEYRML